MKTTQYRQPKTVTLLDAKINAEIARINQNALNNCEREALKRKEPSIVTILKNKQDEHNRKQQIDC